MYEGENFQMIETIKEFCSKEQSLKWSGERRDRTKESGVEYSGVKNVTINKPEMSAVVVLSFFISWHGGVDTECDKISTFQPVRSSNFFLRLSAFFMNRPRLRW